MGILQHNIDNQINFLVRICLVIIQEVIMNYNLFYWQVFIDSMLHSNYTQEEYHSHQVIIPASEGVGELILGDLNAATDLQLIKTHNIKTVITAATGLEHLQIPSELTHIVFPLMDLKTQNIQTYFELSYQTIEQNLKRGAVLVHCGAGISRSATLVIAYYMKKYEAVFTNAINFVKKIRPNICPNLGFQLQLKKYQKDLGIGQEKLQTPVFKKKNSLGIKQYSIGQPKQMLFTFNIPSNKYMNPINRVTTTVKPHIKPVTSSLCRSNLRQKGSNQLEINYLFIRGKQAGGELKNTSMYDPKHYSMNNTLMGTWNLGKANFKKQSAVYSFKF